MILLYIVLALVTIVVLIAVVAVYYYLRFRKEMKKVRDEIIKQELEDIMNLN